MLIFIFDTCFTKLYENNNILILNNYFFKKNNKWKHDIKQDILIINTILGISKS